MLKNLQRDLRDIRAEFDKMSNETIIGLCSRRRTTAPRLRLREIAAIAEGHQGESPLLNRSDVQQLIDRFHACV